MYWKEVPVQVQAMDSSGSMSKPLEDRFQAGVDALSMFDGSSSTDAYLESWEWGDYIEMDGSAQNVMETITERINNSFPIDFVARIRDLELEGNRDPRPGAVDHWLEERV
jgi:hypothetical protein